jgi:hypothetical protein
MKALLALLLVVAAAIAADTNQPPDRPALTIRASFSVFLLRSNEFLYTNNVVVYDPPARTNDAPTTMTCNWLTAKRGLDGKIETIIAHDRVKIDQGDNHARGHLAVYTGSNEVVTLTGAFDPGDTSVPQLPVLFSPKGTNYGTKIDYHRLEDKLLIKDPVTYIPQSSLSKGESSRTNSAATNKTRGPATPFSIK